MLQGYTGHLSMWRNRSAFRLPYPEAADQQIAARRDPPCIIVYIDAWTAYGGSPVRRLARHRELPHVPLRRDRPVRRRHLPHARRSGAPRVAGKSSGGFGAFITPMLRPDLFGGLASHAGDALYECLYVPEFAKIARSLRDKYESSYEKFWDDFRSRVPMSKRDDGHQRDDVRVRRVLLGRGRRHRDAAVRHRDGQADRRRVGALAGVGSGAHGAAVRRRVARAAGDLHRRRHAGRLVPRSRRQGDGERARRDRASPTCSSSSSTPRMRPSSTATRSGSSTSSSGSPSVPGDAGRGGRSLARSLVRIGACFV